MSTSHASTNYRSEDSEDLPSVSLAPKELEDGAAALRVGVAAAVVVAIIATVFALQFTRALLAPIIVAILISYVLEPLVSRLVARQIPRWAAATVVFLLVLAAAGGVVYELKDQAATLIARLPSAAQELREAVQREQGGSSGPIAQVQKAADELKRLSQANTAPPPREPIRRVQIEPQEFDFSAYLWSSTGAFIGFAGDLLVVLVLTFYLLLAGDLFRRRFIEIAGPTLSRKKITLQILNDISAQVSIYLFARFVISVFVAVATWLVLWTAGLGQPAAWGIVAGVLNVIPYLGPAAAEAGVGLAAFLQFHTLASALGVVGLTILVAALEAYVVTPWLTSRAGRMNPAAVFLGLIFWGWLWGVPGLLLAVPLLMILKAVSEHVEFLQPIVALLKA